MADNISQSQHITELDFDISNIYSQMQEIEQELISEGTRINDIINKNWKISDIMGNSNALNADMSKFNSQMKKYNELSEKATAIEKEKKQTTNQTYAVNEKTYSLIKKMTNAKGSDATTERAKLTTMQDESNELVKQLQLNGNLSSEQVKQLGTLQASENSLLRIRTQSQGIFSSFASFFSSARLKSFIAYRTFSLITRGIRTAVTTVKDIEYSMMEIARVMQLSSSETTKFRDTLMGLSADYGRAFEDVEEVSLRYAQAGYNQNEVISMTKDSLLALNTAELDVENSTNSMIGILQQWNLEATDLGSVMDKLNYTSDNNAVTTQDLVDALLRASSAAKNAKMSFNDTIGTIVAMKEASGRTGKEVGNALNSIIAYVQRAKSLKVFEGLGIQVYTDETRQNFVPILDMLGQLSDKVKIGGDSVIDTLTKQTELTELYSEDLAIAAGAEDEYTKAVESEKDANNQNLSDVEKKSALELAGMHRRNYFIALLGNFNKIQGVSNALIDSEGYSIQENSKHMETLTAKYNQLITSLKELAVQFADAGAMDIAKKIMDITTGIIKVTGKIGGIRTALLGVFSVMQLIKGYKTIKDIAEVQVGIKNLTSNIKAMGTAAKTTGLTLNFALGILGFIATGVSVISGLISTHNQKLEEAKQKAIANAQASKEEYEQLQGLISSYEELGKKTDLTVDEKSQLKTIQEQLNTLYGAEKEGIDLVNGSYQVQIDKLKELSGIKAKDALFSQYSVTDTAISDYETTTNKDFAFVDPTSVNQDDYKNYAKALSRIDKLNYKEFVDTAKGSIYSLKFDEDTTSAEAYNAVGKALDNLNTVGITSGKVWDKLISLQSTYDTESQSVIEELEKEIVLLEVTGLNDEKLARDKILLAKAQETLNIQTDNLTTSQDENADSNKKTVLTTEQLAEKQKELATAYETLDKQISTNSSCISGLNKVIEDVNNEQILSADQILDLVDNYGLLSSQVIKVSGGYTVEAGVLEDLKQAKINEAETAENAQIQATISAIQGTIDRTSAYYDEIMAIKDLATAQETLSNMETDEREKASHINSGSQAKEFLDYVEENKNVKSAVQDIVTLLENKELRISSLYENIGKSVSNASSSASKDVEDDIEEVEISLNDLTKAFEHLNSMGIYSTQEQIDFYENLRRDIRLTADDVQSVEKTLQGLYKDQFSEKLDMLDKEKDKRIENIEETYNKEIDRINDLKDALSEDREDEDYFEQRAKLLEELSGFQQRTGPDARENEKNKLEEIADLDKEYRREQEDETLDDQIDSLEEQKDNEIETVEDKYNEIMDMFTSVNQELVATAGVFAPEIYNQFTEFFTNPFEQDLSRLSLMMSSLSGVSVSAVSTSGTIPTFPSNKSNLPNNHSESSSASVTLGEKVKILSSATNYGGQNSNVKIPNSVKNTPYTVSQIGYNDTQALLKEIYSWVNLSDLVGASTGGMAKEDGAIFMRKDEFIIKPELAKWLESQAKKGNVNNNNNNYNNARTIIQNFNKPLYTVEKQVVSDKADASMVANKAVRTIVKNINKKLG